MRARGKPIVPEKPKPIKLNTGHAFILLSQDDSGRDVCVITEIKNGRVLFAITYQDRESISRAFLIWSWELRAEIYDGSLIYKALTDPEKAIEKLESKSYDLTKVPFSLKNIAEYLVRLSNACPALLYDPVYSKWMLKALV